MPRHQVLTGIALTVLLCGCAAPGAIVLKDPKTGASMDCTYSDQPRYKAMLEAQGGLQDAIKQCMSRRRDQGWVCVSGCEKVPQ